VIKKKAVRRFVLMAAVLEVPSQALAVAGVLLSVAASSARC